ncbi:hypothetical protein, partial [Pseudomonas avellanae]|uniref:hypothetical protein n=1 Tax=Pseudomonas avellanae TaxID=46257 RepID=UPI0019D3A243
FQSFLRESIPRRSNTFQAVYIFIFVGQHNQQDTWARHTCCDQLHGFVSDAWGRFAVAAGLDFADVSDRADLIDMMLRHLQLNLIADNYATHKHLRCEILTRKLSMPSCTSHTISSSLTIIAKRFFTTSQLTSATAASVQLTSWTAKPAHFWH